MKIYFYMTTVLEHGGGFENSFIDIAKGLVKRNIEVEMVTMNERFTQRLGSLLSIYFRTNLNKNPVHRESTDVIISKLEGIKYTKCQNIKELRRKLGEADVIYSKNEVIEASILKFLIHYKKLPPIIFLCGTTLFYPNPQSREFKLHNFIYTGMIYKFLTSGVLQFHLKNSNDATIINRLHKGVSAVKVYNPFKFEELYNDAKYNKLTLVNPKSFNIAWIGRLEQQKGIKDLIKLINNINTSEFVDAVTWNIAGEGNEKAVIEQEVKKWKNVKYYGHVPHKQIPSLLRQCDLFITTSRAESFGNNIVEANAMGLPAIAYDIPGPKEIIEQNKNGVLVSDIIEFEKTVKECILGSQKFYNIEDTVKSKFDSEIVYDYTADIMQNFYKRHLIDKK